MVTPAGSSLTLLTYHGALMNRLTVNDRFLSAGREKRHRRISHATIVVMKNTRIARSSGLYDAK